MEEKSSPATVPFTNFSDTDIKSGNALLKLSLYTFARKVAYKIRSSNGVIKEAKNIPLSLKNTFIFLLVIARKVFIVSSLPRVFYP